MSAYLKCVIANAAAVQKTRQRRAFFKEISAPFRVALPWVLISIFVLEVFSRYLEITRMDVANLATAILHNFK
ncbi:hypothetical protein OYT1_ch1388 [Ferriphaselus amnicola]|uniref:Uncharacterized protein n=1 Tax=Ferriphaselus amnicola TaxID=1188319 RepID=A0A2Z6GCR8_9PROT|nr:hypothetical protein [Ferriphaselus amnicola]BBE50945.1 hypothetical protein OYT1_ch1388 [Ferriphaselus amnicola]